MELYDKKIVEIKCTRSELEKLSELLLPVYNKEQKEK